MFIYTNVHSMAMATKATAIRENPAVVLTPALDPAVDEEPAGAEVVLVEDPPVLDGTTATVVEERVDLVVALAPLLVGAVVAPETTTTAEEVPDVPAVVVPAGAVETVVEEDGEEESDEPVPGVLSWALVDDPTLPAATQVPATLLPMS